MHLENSVTDFISSALAQQVNGAGLLHTTYGTPKHVALEVQTIVSFFLFLHYGFRLFALLWIYNFFVTSMVHIRKDKKTSEVIYGEK
ncbi:hypothetical protein HanPI659440_Chr00c04g0712361 [Helianthus annuus]|nr:hypothetical protein HanPI659440_Chr00c04g0712361 [Helianthus annuus]